MELIAGRFYKTRDGKKACIGGISPFAEVGDCYRAVGWIEGVHGSASWCLDGRWTPSGRLHDCDLVEEWHEPRTWEHEVCIYRFANGQIDPQFGRVRDARAVLLACKPITLTEGEGV